MFLSPCFRGCTIFLAREKYCRVEVGGANYCVGLFGGTVSIRVRGTHNGRSFVYNKCGADEKLQGSDNVGKITKRKFSHPSTHPFAVQYTASKRKS